MPDFHRLRLEASRTNQRAWVAQVAKRFRTYLLQQLVEVVVAAAIVVVVAAVVVKVQVMRCRCCCCCSNGNR